MKRSRYTEEQISGILQEQEAGTSVAELCRKRQLSDATFYTWKSRYGELEVRERSGYSALSTANSTNLGSRRARLIYSAS
jgi:putative transposase